MPFPVPTSLAHSYPCPSHLPSQILQCTLHRAVLEKYPETSIDSKYDIPHGWGFFCKSRFAHVSPLLQELHWLPITFSSNSKCWLPLLKPYIVWDQTICLFSITPTWPIRAGRQGMLQTLSYEGLTSRTRKKGHLNGGSCLWYIIHMEKSLFPTLLLF